MALRRLARGLRDGSDASAGGGTSSSSSATSVGRDVGRRHRQRAPPARPSLATALGASRRSRTFCDSFSSSPVMRAVLRCTVIAADAEPHALGAQAGDVEQRDGRRRAAGRSGPPTRRARRRRRPRS